MAVEMIVATLPIEPTRTKEYRGPRYASCTVYKNDSQRSYRLLATLAGYLIVSLTLITTARRSPLERFGLNASCIEVSLHGQLLDAAGADRGCNIAMHGKKSMGAATILRLTKGNSTENNTDS